MKIVICGAGQVGYHLARYLSENDNHVTVIDNDREVIQRANDRLDVRAIYGYASYPEVLREAGIEEADLLIAVTQHDEINMIACEVTNALFPGPLKIARVRNQSYLHARWENLFSKSHISIDYIISPEIELARSISRSLMVPGAFTTVVLGDGLVKMVGVRCLPSMPIVNTPVDKISALLRDVDISIIAIAREQDRFIPGGKDIIKAGDEVYFLADAAKIDQVMTIFGYTSTESHRVLILGGGNVGFRLAQDIHQLPKDFDVSIIERDPKRAHKIAEDLKESIVLCGDSLDADLLQEAEVHTADTVVAVTQDDRVNVLSALLSKKMGARRSLILLNNPSYGPLLSSLGVDGIINPRSLTVSRILNYIRCGQVKGVTSVAENLGALVEGYVNSVSDLVGTLAVEHNVKRKILIAAIVRREQILIPNTKTLIEEGDRLLVMGTISHLKSIESLFSSSLDFL